MCERSGGVSYAHKKSKQSIKSARIWLNEFVYQLV